MRNAAPPKKKQQQQQQQNTTTTGFQKFQFKTTTTEDT